MVETGLIRECNVSNFDKLVDFNMTYYEEKKVSSEPRHFRGADFTTSVFLPDGLTANSYFGINFCDAHFHVGSKFLINLRFR